MGKQALSSGCLDVVACRVGIHGEQSLAQELLVFVGNLDLGQLALDIEFELPHIVLRVVVGMVCAVQLVHSDVVVGIEAVVAVDLVVDVGADGVQQVRLAEFLLTETVEVVVDAGCHMIVDFPLQSEDARPHADDVVVRPLLPVGVVALQLILLCLEEVAGVVLIADGEWHDVEVDEAVEHVALPTEDQHLQDALLRAIVGVLGASLPLCDPEVLMLFGDGEVHVTGEFLTCPGGARGPSGRA